MNDFENDELILAELKRSDLGSFSLREKAAIKELALENQGALIYLILSFQKKIRDLEEKLQEKTKKAAIA